MQSIKECCSGVDTKSVGQQAQRVARRFLPVISWAPTLTSKKIIADCTGGFIAGVMIVPTCLSWASLAGLNLSCGLSAALMASLSYGTFGSCAVLSIGPVAEITTLLISISGIPEAKREQTFQSIGVQVGIVSVLLSFTDGGKVIKTIFAKPVGDGYTCAAALLAICVQLKTMFNVKAPAATLIQDVLYQTIKALIQQFSIKCVYSFLLFMTYCLYLIYIKKTKLPLWIPHQLIVVVVSTLVTYNFKLYSEDSLHLGIVGTIPSGLKKPDFPPWENVIGLGPYTLTITIISFVQMYVIAQRVMPDINPNGELFASGVTNFLCNVFGGMPVTNSFSVSSVLLEQHVNTPLTAYAAATVLFITITFLTKLGVFYYLPKQALGAIVVASVWRLVDFSGPMRLWQYSKKDAAVWVVTFVLTIFGGITVGVLGGIGLSLILVVLRVARPRAVAVGFNMSTFHYGDISKDPELLVYPNILLWRFDAPLYFVNAGYFQEKLLKAIQAEVRPIDVVLVTCGKVVDIDAAALGALPTMIDSIAKADKNRPRRIILCDIHGRLEQVLLASEALPMYVPDEYDRLSIDQIEKTGKFPVVFKKLEDAIGFAQRCVSEWYGNVDTAPYPNVSFLTDLVVEAARMQDAGGGSALEAIADHEEAKGGAGGEDDDDEGRGPGMAHETAPGALTLSRSAGRGGAHGNSSNNMNVHLLVALEKLKKLSSFSPDRELIGVIGVVRHTEVTPRQKEKILFTERHLIHCVFKNDASLTESKRSPADLEGLFAALEELLQNGRLRHADSWRRVMTVVRSNPPGLKIKVKAQPIYPSHEGSFSSLDVRRQQQLEPHTVASVQAARFVVKWGGVPTRSGLAQAHVLGEKLFARFYAAGDLPLRRLLAFTKKPTVFASDDSRVVSTALVVTNALTQSAPVEEEDIILDDVLLKTLSPTAKRLLHDEYKYFEALMHIGSHAAARHYFHIPGFRQLLLIPPLDRPLTMGGDGFGDEEATEDFFDNSNWRPKDAVAKATGVSSVPQEGAAGVGYRGTLGGTGIGSHSLDPLGDHVTANGRTDISFFHGARALGNRAAFVGGGGVGRRQQQQRSTLANSDYYTPFEVMQELEKNLRVVVEMKLPHHILSLPLSNHETLRELRQRYGTMLRVFLGAKQRQKMSTREALARRGQEGSPGSSVGQPSPRRKQRLNASDSEEDEDGNDDEEEEEEEEEEYGSSMDPGAPSSVATHTNVTKDGGEHEEEEEELEVVGGSSEGEEGDAAEEEGASDNSSETGGDAVMAEIMSTQREQEGITGPATDADVSPIVKGEHEDKEADASPALKANLVHEESTGVFAASHTTQPYSSAINAARVSAQQLSTTAVSHTTEAANRTKKATLAGKGSKDETKSYLSGSTPYSPKTPSTPPNFAPHPRLDARGPSTSPPGAGSGSKRYDLSDISKLRDHGSYDLSYNVAILKSFHAATRMPEMRRLMDALARIARITECMSRVGENVLEGVNSSKRFIIGSLVSGGLLESIYYDYKDFAKMDERKGVKELLYRAQALYMAERGGVEQDVQHVVKLFRRFGKRRKAAGDAAVFEPLRGDEPYRDETPAEREFRLKFPFISLPKEDPLTCSSRGAAQQRGSGRPSAKVQKNNKARARPTGPTTESNGEDDGWSATRFYFTTYLHVEGALQCLFESVMVEGFSRPSKEELEESQQLYMKHLIFKVFRRRNYSFTDAEALAAFRKLHLLFRSEVDYGRQQRELRAALANTYHSMYYLSMEVYLSLGDSEGVGGAEPLVGPLMYLDGSDAFAGEGGDDVWMSTEDQRLGGGGRRSSQSASGMEEEDDDEDGVISEADLAHTAPGSRQGTPVQGSTQPTRALRSAFSQHPHKLGEDEELPIIAITAPGEQQPHQTLSFASANARSTSPRSRFTSTPGTVSASYDALSGVGSGHSPRSPSFASGRQPPLTNSTFAESTLVRLNANVAAASDAAVAMSSAVVSSLRGASPVSFAEGDGGAVSVAVSAEPSLVALQQPPAKKARKAHHANKKAATVLTTPQAGRGAAAVQEMKNRVSSVTPMRRIHEGMSLDDFLRLIKEAESAILSQETDD